MKKIKDYKEEIHKCSKCGLCQSVCPIYLQTGNDCSVSRGKFIMLNGIIKGDLTVNKNVNKYLDLCLKCNACKNFCPSGIDARKIFIAAKSEYFESTSNAKLIKLLNSPAFFNTFLSLSKFASNTYRTLKLDKIVKKLYPVFLKISFAKPIILANEFITNNYQKNINHIKKVDKTSNKKLKVVYFSGCVNDYINPQNKQISKDLLRSMDVEILNPKFQCCGVPFLSSGNLEQFIKQAELNLSKIPDYFDYFLTDCASCQDAFKEYETYLQDPKLLEKIKKINQKSINIVDFITKESKSIIFDKKITFTFHKPCHLEDMGFLQDFLKKSINIQYFEMKDFDKCCGFSGEFALKNRNLSKMISLEKAQNAIMTNADYIVTSCPSCILGLNQGMLENASESASSLISPQKIVTFLELISMAKIEA